MTASQAQETTAVYSDLTGTESDLGRLFYCDSCSCLVWGEPLKGMIYGPLSNEGT